GPCSGPDRGATDVCLRASAGGIGPVEAVEPARLRHIGSGGKGEVGVAAGFPQHTQLIRDAAPATVGPAVVERPVAVNEAVDQLAGRAVSGEQVMAGGERFLELQHRMTESVGAVAVVVQMDLDFTEAAGAQFRESVEIVGL